MLTKRSVALAVSLVLTGQFASAQDTFRYREFALGSRLDSVVAASDGRAEEVKTLHATPAVIQELRWRPPYVGSADTLSDPVREIVFSFYNDSLYQIVVTYDRARTEGLTNVDVLDALSETYGVPTSPHALTAASVEGFPDRVVLARWESAGALVTLLGGTYAPEFRLVLVDNRLITPARTAIAEALRMIALDEPRREAERRKQETEAADAAREKARSTNRAVFRP